MLFAEVRNETSEQGSRPRVATSFDFLIELCAIATPLLPSLEQVGLVGIKQAPSMRRATPFRKGLSPDEPMDGLPTDFESSRDVTQTQALLVERSDGFIAAIPVGTARLGVRFGSSHGRRPSAPECGRHIPKMALLFRLFVCFRNSDFLPSPPCFVRNGIR